MISWASDVDVASFVFCLLAVIALLVGAAAMAYRRQYRATHHRMVLALFVTLLFVWLLQLLLDLLPAAATFCYLFAFCNRGLKVAAFFWEMAIAVNVFGMVVRQRRFSNADQLLCHWFVWTAALLLACLPMTTSDLADPAQLHCWPPDPAWQLVTYCLPLLAAVLFIVAAYLAVAVVLIRRARAAHAVKQQKGMVFIVAYPLLFVAFWLPTLVYDFTAIVAGANSYSVHAILICEQCHAIVSVLAYCWSLFFRGCNRRHPHPISIDLNSIE